LNQKVQFASTGSVGHNDRNKKKEVEIQRGGEVKLQWSDRFTCFVMQCRAQQLNNSNKCPALQPNQPSLAFSGTTLTPMIIFELKNRFKTRRHFLVQLFLCFQNIILNHLHFVWYFLRLHFNCFYCFSPLTLSSLLLFFERKNTSPFLLSVAVRLRGEAICY
jgi:hypothetical protein